MGSNSSKRFSQKKLNAASLLLLGRIKILNLLHQGKTMEQQIVKKKKKKNQNNSPVRNSVVTQRHFASVSGFGLKKKKKKRKKISFGQPQPN